MKNLIYFTLISATLLFLTNCASTNTVQNDTFIGSPSSDKTISISRKSAVTPGKTTTTVSEEITPVVIPDESTLVVEEPTLVVPEEPTLTVDEPTLVVPDEPTLTVDEPTLVVPDEPILTVDESTLVVPDEPTLTVEEPIITKPEKETPIVTSDLTPVISETETPVIQKESTEKKTAPDFWNRKKTKVSDSKKTSDISNEKAPAVSEKITITTVPDEVEPVLSDRRSAPVVSTDDVSVYYLDKSFIPKGSKSLSKTSVTGSKEAGGCDSLSVVEMLKDYARQIGGNAVYISKHEKPSLWTIPCHKMEATIFDITTTDSSVSTKIAKTDYKTAGVVDDAYIASRKRQSLPKVYLTLEGGASYWDVKKESYMDEVHKTLSDDLRFGPSWGASLDYFFSKNWGIGVSYYGFTSDSEVTTRFIGSDGSAVDTKYESSVLFTYVGPRILVRAPLGERWLFDAFVGAGYLAYESPYKVNAKKSTQKEEVVGGQLGCHLEYKLSRYFGITAGVSSGMILNDQFKRNNFTQNKKEDLLHVDGMLGIRFHFF